MNIQNAHAADKAAPVEKLGITCEPLWFEVSMISGASKRVPFPGWPALLSVVTSQNVALRRDGDTVRAFEVIPPYACEFWGQA